MQTLTKKKKIEKGGRPKKFKDPFRISIILEKERYDYLVKQGIRMSTESEKSFSISDVVRMSLDTVYPPPQAELFKIKT